MAEVNEVCKFDVGADQIQFRTQTNGDSVSIGRIHLTQEQATSLAFLVNSGEDVVLQVRIKVKD